MFVSHSEDHNGLRDDLLAFLPLSNQTESIGFQQQKSRNKTTLLSLTTKQKPKTTTTILLMTN